MPVNGSSPPRKIKKAFEESGYLRGLSYEQRTRAFRDPARWLKGHPYLYDAFPTHFSKAPRGARQIQARRRRIRRTRRPSRGLGPGARPGRRTYDEEASRILTSIENDVTSLWTSANSLESDVASVDSLIGALSSRLTRVRARGYVFLGYLDKSLESLVKKWAEAGPQLKQTVQGIKQPLRLELEGVRGETQRLRSQLPSGRLDPSGSWQRDLSSRVSRLRSTVTSQSQGIRGQLSQFQRGINSIDGDLRVAEHTVTYAERASFPLKEEEGVVLALEGKLMKGDGGEGTLFMTNHRFIFEGRREVVLEKKWFITTKKKTERYLAVDAPIGMVGDIAIGRVGLLAWTGVYVQFKPETSREELPIDVKGEEAERIRKMFNYIVSGDADSDRSALLGLASEKAPSPQVVRCWNCGAPYTEEIYRGQTSLTCEYCGAAIQLQG